jgi:putative hydrolase of the HAD superfamily
MLKVIFLDAVGTLFGVRGSVGESYAKIANKFGISAPPDILNKAFFQSFLTASPMAFPGVKVSHIPQKEYDWWYAIAHETFQTTGYLEQFSNFDQFFVELYDYFQTAEPWFVYPEVKETLAKWQNQGWELAVLSNFDSRLYPVLEVLGLSHFFKSVTISTEVGFAKPDVNIFLAALQKHDCTPDTVLHIGDSFKADYLGAKNAGMQAIWLDRDGDINTRTDSIPPQDYAVSLEFLDLA